MKHVDLRPSFNKTMAAATSTPARATQPHGVKVMTDGEDSKWVDADGVEHSVRDLPAALAALAAELETGVSTASKANTVSTEPAPAAATGYPAGAFWTRVEMIDGDLVARERWTVVDDAWTPVGLDASTLVTGTVDAGLIDAVALAARMVTAGLIRTSATGQRVELTSDGLILWLVDDDGVEREGVRIGPTGATLITVGKTLITPSAVTAPQGTFDAINIAGQTIGQYTTAQVWDTAPRMITIGGAGLASGNIACGANVETGIFDVVVQGVQPSHWYRAEVELLTYPRGTDAEVSVNLRNSPVAQGVMTNSPLVTGKRVGPVSGSKWDHRHVTFWFPGSAMSFAGNGGSARVLLTVTSSALIEVTRDTTMAVYTEGRYIPFSSTINRGGALMPGSTTNTTVPPSVSKQTYTKTYTATGSTTYYSASNAVDNYTMSRTGDVIQGSYNGSASDRRHGIWWFPDMTADLSGATIKDVSIYAAAKQTYASAGGTAHFWSHPGGNSVVSNVMNATFTAGQSRWLQLPSQFWQQFKDGGAKGFMAYTTSTSTSEYMRFTGGAGSAQIRITYEK